MVVSDHLRVLVMPAVSHQHSTIANSQVHAATDDKSADYVCNRKLGAETLKSFLEVREDDKKFAEQCAAARGALETIDLFIGDKIVAGKPPFLGGQPSHADFVLFGMYAWTRMCPRTTKEVWEHESMKGIPRWLEAMMASGLVKEEDLP